MHMAYCQQRDLNRIKIEQSNKVQGFQQQSEQLPTVREEENDRCSCRRMLGGDT